MLRAGSVNQDIKEVLINKSVIRRKVKSLADQIVADYQAKNKPPVIIAIMMGAIHFYSDLMRAIGSRMQIEPDFIVIKSYEGTRSSGTVKILIDLRTNIADRDIIVVEDIVDTGRTMRALLDLFAGRHPRSIRTCILLDKPSARQFTVQTDYVGFELPNVFVVGYGLDYNEGYRQLPFIGILAEEVYLG